MSALFTYEKLILAMDQKAPEHAFKDLVDEACGASEFLFDERDRGLCMVLCMNPAVSIQDLTRLAARWPHHVRQNTAFSLDMVMNPREPPKDVPREPGFMSVTEMARRILESPRFECDSLLAHRVARLMEGVNAGYIETILWSLSELGKLLPGEEHLVFLANLTEEAKERVAGIFILREPEIKGRVWYESQMEAILFCEDYLFQLLVNKPSENDLKWVTLFWQERERFNGNRAFKSLMDTLASRVAFSGSGGSYSWTAPWMTEILQVYGYPGGDVRTMCAMLASGILSPEKEADLMKLIAEKRKQCSLTQETP